MALNRYSGNRVAKHDGFRRQISEIHGCQWAYVAGYLDGDGSVEIRVGVFTIRFSLTWADTCRTQLERVRAFLITEGIRPSRIRGGKSTLGRKVWHLSVWELNGVLAACEEMVGFLEKKRAQVRAVIGYLRDTISGNEAIRVFNQDKRRGNWSGKPRKEVIPWKMKEGYTLAKRACGWRG